ncbi:MAG: CPBP family intramembrane metalloprotease [Candidatus Moranbacteria bacterium]|nr:CPBP family intramembrane metalloprotease [Candidatus Moranbacteria bacterium]
MEKLQNKPKLKIPLVTDLIYYCISPKYLKKPKKIKISKKIWHMFRLWGIAITAAIITGSIITFILQKIQYDSGNHSITDLIIRQSPLLIFLLAVVWAPITEEITFRLFLKYSPYRLGFSLTFLILMLLQLMENIWNPFEFLFSQFSPFLILILSLLSIIIGGLILGALFKKYLNHQKIKLFLKRNFKTLFFCQAVAFAILHILNYTNLKAIIYFTPFLVLPQLILGFILGFTRMQYGLIWSIILHAIYNGILTLPPIILSFLSRETFQNLFSNQDASIPSMPWEDAFIILFILLPVIIFLILFYLIINSFNLYELVSQTKKNQQLEACQNLPK